MEERELWRGSGEDMLVTEGASLMDVVLEDGVCAGHSSAMFELRTFPKIAATPFSREDT